MPFEYRRVPTPSGVSAEREGSEEFFGRGEQFALLPSGDLLVRDVPRQHRRSGRATGRSGSRRSSISTTSTPRNATSSTSRRKRGGRASANDLALQEAFGEVKLFDVGANYDFVSVRAGIQPFTSDFRGFLFRDTNLGVRVFGNWGRNRNQWNVAYFNQLEKETNSELNLARTAAMQEVLHCQLLPAGLSDARLHDLAELPRQHRHARRRVLLRRERLPRPSLPDRPDPAARGEGVLRRPRRRRPSRPPEHHAPVLPGLRRGRLQRHLGSAGRHQRAVCRGGAVDRQGLVPAARRASSSLPATAIRTTTRRKGFDAILDNPNIIGRALQLLEPAGPSAGQTGLSLVGRSSVLPTCAAARPKVRPTSSTPACSLPTLGFDAEITTKMRVDLQRQLPALPSHRNRCSGSCSRARSIKPSDSTIRPGLQYRPALNDNVLLTAGVSVFQPGTGFKQILTNWNALHAVRGR